MKPYFNFSHQWDSLNPFESLNWRDFTFLHVGGEVDYVLTRVDFTVVILGLSANFGLFWSTAMLDEMHETVRKIESGEVETVALEDLK